MNDRQIDLSKNKVSVLALFFTGKFDFLFQN